MGDNRVKDAMGAFQSHVGKHGKKYGSLTPIVPNENRAFRVTAQRSRVPKPSADGRGTSRSCGIGK
jgi:hypothetical protein